MGEDGQDNGQGNNDDGERSENEGGWEKIERPVFAWWLGRVAFLVVGVHVGGCGMFWCITSQEGGQVVAFSLCCLLGWTQARTGASCSSSLGCYNNHFPCWLIDDVGGV